LIFDFFYNLYEDPVVSCCITCKCKENEKKIFGSGTSYENGLTFLVKNYIRVKFFFFTIGTCLVSKDAELYVELKNVNLPLCKIAQKKLLAKKDMLKKLLFGTFFVFYT